MSYKHITTHERCCIANFIELGWSLRKIANHLYVTMLCMVYSI